MDLLVTAFENQLDSLFHPTHWTVSAMWPHWKGC